jgi:FecR protein
MAIHPRFSRPDYQSRLTSGVFSIVTRQRFSFGALLMCWLVVPGTHSANAMPSPFETDYPAATSDAVPGLTRLAQTKPAQAQTPSSAPAPTAAPSPAAPGADEPIGNVATLTGSATVSRNNAATPLQLQDDIFQGDVLQTQANSALGVTFTDATTFNLTANATITVDSFVYEDGGKQNGALFDVARGTVAFVAAAVAHTGDMRISTPSATLGIRGTTGLIEVPQGASATNARNVSIKLYPDADGRVGRIEVNGRDGSRLGFLTQGSSGFTLRPGAMGRVAAVPLVISPQQALRDQGIVRQVHAAQSVGREIVTQRRIQRQQNPNQNPARGNPPATAPRQPGPQRQNGLPQRPGLPQQPGAPQQPGTPQRLGAPQQPGVLQQPGSPRAPGSLHEPGSSHEPALPNRAGQPQLQPPPGAQPGLNAPGVQRPGLQNRPALLPRRPALPPAPKGKPRKEKR